MPGSGHWYKTHDDIVAGEQYPEQPELEFFICFNVNKSTNKKNNRYTLQHTRNTNGMPVELWKKCQQQT
jgi:hypothetical protein